MVMLLLGSFSQMWPGCTVGVDAACMYCSSETTLLFISSGGCQKCFISIVPFGIHQNCDRCVVQGIECSPTFRHISHRFSYSNQSCCETTGVDVRIIEQVSVVSVAPFLWEKDVSLLSAGNDFSISTLCMFVCVCVCVCKAFFRKFLCRTMFQLCLSELLQPT